MNYLLDTCALIWLGMGGGGSRKSPVRRKRGLRFPQSCLPRYMLTPWGLGASLENFSVSVTPDGTAIIKR